MADQSLEKNEGYHYDAKYNDRKQLLKLLSPAELKEYQETMYLHLFMHANVF